MQTRDFIGEHVKAARKKQVKGIFAIWLVAAFLILGGVAFLAEHEIMPMIIAVPVIAPLAVGAIIWAIITLVKNEEHFIKLHSREMTLEEIRRTISEEVRQERILLEDYFQIERKKFSDRFILLSSYLFIAGPVLTVIPVKDIIGVDFRYESATNKSSASIVYQVSTKEKTYSFKTGFPDGLHARQLVDRLNYIIENIAQSSTV